MNLSSASAPIPTGLVSAPPLSPPPTSSPASSVPPSAPAPAVPVAAPAPPPDAAPPAPPARSLPLEAMLLRVGLLTPDQLSEAMKDEAVTGKKLAEIVVERGWVTQDELDRLEDSPAPAAPPRPTQAPAPSSSEYRIFIRLTTGERLEVATVPGLDEAKNGARELIRRLGTHGEGWPFIGGRFVRPDAVVSVDLDTALS